jgi:hypothetical protein
MNTTEENDPIRQTLVRAMPDDLPPTVADRMRNQLAAFRNRLDAKSKKPRSRISQWMGGFTTRQRIAVFGSAGAAAVLGFFLLWGGIAANPVSAMEKMAENVRKAKSFKFVMVRSYLRDQGEPPVVDYTSTVYWLAPSRNERVGSMRFETKRPKGWKGRPGEFMEPIWIQVPGRPILNIEHRNKTFCRYSSNNSNTDEWSLCQSLQDLGKLSGEADRQLGTREIKGRKVRGFEIDNNKIRPNDIPGSVEIWIDASTNLPVSVHFKSRINGDYGDVHLDPMQFTNEITDIQWNLPFDAKLFDTTPPKGYIDTTPKAPASNTQIRQIVTTLEYYAKTNTARYPQVDGVDQLVAAMNEWFLDIKRKQPKENYFTKELEVELQKVGEGSIQIENIEVNDPDAVYHGSAVKPGDKGKVLLRWQIDDGRYQVIFGDLRAETVTAERLRELEAK